MAMLAVIWISHAVFSFSQNLQGLPMYDHPPQLHLITSASVMIYQTLGHIAAHPDRNNQRKACLSFYLCHFF